MLESLLGLFSPGLFESLLGNLWMTLAMFAVGVLLLIKGGDWFVDGAAGLARRFRKISADIEEIYTLAQTIRQYSAFPGCPSEVSDSAARIMVLASMLEKAE